MEAVRGIETAKNLYEGLSASLEWHKLSWNKVIIVTSDKSQVKTLVIWRQCEILSVKCVLIQKYYFCLCIIHQEVLGKTLLSMNHVTSTVMQPVNFIWAHALSTESSYPCYKIWMLGILMYHVTQCSVTERR